MEPISRKLQHRTEEAAEHTQEHTSEQVRSSIRTFEEVEDLLRHDAKQVDLPAGIEDRLHESLAAMPPAPRSWVDRLFRR